jgi:hypothetical protein
MTNLVSSAQLEGDILAHGGCGTIRAATVSSFLPEFGPLLARCDRMFNNGTLQCAFDATRDLRRKAGSHNQHETVALETTRLDFFPVIIDSILHHRTYPVLVNGFFYDTTACADPRVV